ncbi:hypothetical protein [Parapedobacter sp. 10938]|uniref:hypothetical protein n=1 Tax=Parapedobacter flavus TaxID=3110225 RepID=UPI002DBE77D9|nr:hypothetical protein [Parapedobacter sp. 10938]MEC3878198.1 hypothetical protein [Parapedobacter sp. 10938]
MEREASISRSGLVRIWQGIGTAVARHCFGILLCDFDERMGIEQLHQTRRLYP